MIATCVYGLSSLMCLACTYLLLRSLGRGGHRLLLWSALCFVGLAVNNVLAVVDVNTPTAMVDLSIPRIVISIISVGILVYGLIWESA